MEAINGLHEIFARNLTHSTGAYLRITFSVALVSAEHFSYREFVGGVPEGAYLSSCKLAPFGARGLIQLDLGVSFALIDVLLGGEGAGEPKLNCTGGGFSAPGCAVKNGRCAKPNMPAIKFVGKLRTATL